MIVRRGLLFGIAMVSAASLMLEICCTRLFSVTLFYHFAFLVVSLALFGIGVAGVVVYLRQRSFAPDRFERLLAWNAAGFGVTVVAALFAILHIQAPPVFGWQSLLNLALLYLITALPFFFSGMCLSLAVTILKEQISRIYFYDLVGAAAGCLLTIPAINLLGGPTAVLFAGALGASAVVLFVFKGGLPWTKVVSLAALLWGWGLVGADLGLGLFPVPSVKAVNEREVVFSRWNSFSRVTVSRTPEDFHWMNIDSDAATRIFAASAAENGAQAQRRFSETRLASLVYAVRNGGHALIIGPGGGADVIAAIARGVKKVTGVELNEIIVDDIMGDRFSEYSGRLYQRPDVEVVVGEGRSFVGRSNERFDSIQATLVDTWAATSAGAFTLSENNLYTREAFGDFISHLADEGILTMTRWRRFPPREFVRLISLGVAGLADLGVSDRRQHFFVAADDRMASFLLKRSPYSPEELRVLRETCRVDGLKVLYDPDSVAGLGDLITELIRSPDPEEVWRNYALDISPPTDDRPFFFYSTKPADFLRQLLRLAPDPNENGVQVLVGLLVVVLGLVLLFILVPLFVFRRKDLRGARGRRTLQLLFFVAIGVGFIGLEVAWMQQFILFLGHPIFALGVVLFVLLLGSGIGSYLTRSVAPERVLHNMLASVSLLVAVVLVYAVFLGPLFRGLVGLPLGFRVAISAMLIGLPGLLMGRMMPLALKVLSAQSAPLVPWAWGVNGAASVLGSVAAVALSMNLGYRATLFCAALIYLLGTLLFWVGSRREDHQARSGAC